MLLAHVNPILIKSLEQLLISQHVLGRVSPHSLQGVLPPALEDSFTVETVNLLCHMTLGHGRSTDAMD